MKKLLCFALAMALALCGTGALAETVRFVENSPDFDIEMTLPDGAVVASKVGSELVSVVEIANESLAPVRVTIAASDIYGDLSMNDLSDAEIEELKAIAGAQYDDPIFFVETTPSGNKYIHVDANSVYDVDSIFTLYKGYFVELTQWHPDYSLVTPADYGFMLELLYSINFLPIKRA